tara:strand:- start:107 stop:484 length:378 start_codon:yes stop_codon:yes gene_type:complete
MADELTYQFQTALSNGSLKDNHASNSISVDQTTARLIRNVQAIGTADAGEALALGDVGTPGFACLINLDDTNFVEVGVFSTPTFYPTLKLKPGEQQLIRFSGDISAPYARADSESVELFYIIYDD